MNRLTMLLLYGIRNVACRSSSPAFLCVPSRRALWRGSFAPTARFMTADATAGERTEEEKAAIKEAREAKK